MPSLDQQTTDQQPTTTRRGEIKELICEILEIEPEAVSETSLFKEDHGADSLRAIEVLASLERTLDITIDQQELARMVNLQGVYAVVADATPAR